MDNKIAMALDRDCPVCNFPEMHLILVNDVPVQRCCRSCGYSITIPTASETERAVAPEAVMNLRAAILDATETLERLLNPETSWTDIPTEDLHKVQWDLTMLSGLVTAMLVERAGHQDLG